MPGAPAVARDLLDRWSEPHRSYHDRRHLAEVLRALRVLSDGAAPAVVVLAAYWHDAVHDGRPDDEQRSAALAAGALEGLGVPDEVVSEVVRLVLLTVTHRPADGDAGGAQLSDADLAVLGADGDRYRDYAAAVRAEYGHVPDEAFRTGRAEVLDALLAAPRLYATQEGRRRWEARARRNVGSELAALRAGVSAGVAAVPPR